MRRNDVGLGNVPTERNAGPWWGLGDALRLPELQQDGRATLPPGNGRLGRWGETGQHLLPPGREVDRNRSSKDCHRQRLLRWVSLVPPHRRALPVEVWPIHGPLVVSVMKVMIYERTRCNQLENGKTAGNVEKGSKVAVVPRGPGDLIAKVHCTAASAGKPRL